MMRYDFQDHWDLDVQCPVPSFGVYGCHIPSMNMLTANRKQEMSSCRMQAATALHCTSNMDPCKI